MTFVQIKKGSAVRNKEKERGREREREREGGRGFREEWERRKEGG